MKLNHGFLPLLMLLSMTACDKVSIGDTTNNNAAPAPAPVASKNDTTDETATAAPPAPEVENDRPTDPPRPNEGRPNEGRPNEGRPNERLSGARRAP